MISGKVELPFVGEYHPASIDETGYACIDKFIAQIVRAQHVVPTIYGRPDVALGLPTGKGNRIIHLRSPYDLHLHTRVYVGVNHRARSGSFFL